MPQGGSRFRPTLVTAMSLLQQVFSVCTAENGDKGLQ